jgi:hypothetical protein
MDMNRYKKDEKSHKSKDEIESAPCKGQIRID